MFTAFFRAASVPSCVLVASVFAVAGDAGATSRLNDSVVLYDQSTQGIGGASPTQHTSAASDEIADDFEVAGPRGWTVTEVKFSVAFVDPDSTPPGQPPYDVAFYPDINGLPGATAVCSAPATPGATNAGAPGGEINVSVVLPTPCTLPPGRYWLAMSAVLEPPPYSMWGFVTDTPLAYAEPVYRNPDNTYGTGCTDWTPAYTNNRCLLNFASTLPNMLFQVLGTAIQAPDVIFTDGFDR